MASFSFIASFYRRNFRGWRFARIGTQAFRQILKTENNMTYNGLQSIALGASAEALGAEVGAFEKAREFIDAVTLVKAKRLIGPELVFKIKDLPRSRSPSPALSAALRVRSSRINSPSSRAFASLVD
jgi:hypothetical protein